MDDPKTLKPGDECPNCGGAFRRVRALSADAFKRVTDRERPQPFPAFTDTASPDQVAELGALFACVRCPYLTRFKASETALALVADPPTA